MRNTGTGGNYGPPLMDPRVSGAFVGLTLGTQPAQMYRALIEATAFGVKWIVETLRDAGVPTRRFVASGGLASKSPLLLQIYADVLNERIAVAETPAAARPRSRRNCASDSISEHKICLTRSRGDSAGPAKRSRNARLA